MRSGFTTLALFLVLRVGAETNVVQLAPVSLPAPATLFVDWETLRLKEPGFTIDEALRRLPGVFVQNSYNFAQDQRISIRGFGTRAAFGVREIKVLVDGLPESSPDGQTQLDNLDLGSVRGIEVLRRAASSLYGNASGGVINIVTDEETESPFVETRLSGGSFGFQRYQAKTSGWLGDHNYSLNGSWSSIDGYRRHSESENQFVGGKLKYRFDFADAELTTVFNYAHTPWSRDPGGLTRAEVDTDRRQARARNVALDAGEEVSQGRLGFVYLQQLPSGEIRLTQYSLFRDFSNKLPILPAAGDGIVEFDRVGVGGGLRYLWDTFSNQLEVGLDAEFQEDDRQRYANMTGTRGALGLDQVETVRSVGPYVRNNYVFGTGHGFTTGLRYDNVRFKAEDRFLADGNDSGDRVLEQLSWSAGLNFRFYDFELFADVSTAFQTPTTTEFANPTGGGGFNTALEPQTARNYEIGVERWLTGIGQIDLSLFLLQIDDELIPFTSPGGRDFFRNAGRSERKGIELGWKRHLSRDWTWEASYTVMDAHYRDYVTAGGNFSGNREPGIPAHQFFTELRWRQPTRSGFFGSVDLQYVDQFELNDANTAKNEAYTLLNARFGYTKRFDRSTLTPFVALNNLLNLRYNGQTRLNAFGGRFFEPAPRFAIFGGVTWRMEF